jgi:hypothetical protein
MTPSDARLFVCSAMLASMPYGNIHQNGLRISTRNALHESAYLDHCRRYALAAAA